MRLRPVPASAVWLVRMFCSRPEEESLVGDLVEQYQHGRSRFWLWRQVIAIVFLRLYREAPRTAASTDWARIKQLLAAILVLAISAALLMSDIWIVFLAPMLGGVFAAALIVLLGHRSAPPAASANGQRYHPGISIQHIPVEGAVGLLFVVGTLLIFGLGVPAVRGMILITTPFGIAGAAILWSWHRHHPAKLQGLGLDK